jgi:hypothetical protein
MEMVCPECLGTLETSDGRSARCTTHGGEFQILFSRWRPATVPPLLGAGPALTVGQPAVAEPPLLADLPPAIPVGVHCVQHPAVAATSQCKLCGAFMCATCDFTLPGNLHVCPSCATAPRTEMSPRRKRFMWGAYGFAIFATLGLGLLMSGVFAGMAETKGGESALGILISLLVLVPAIVGMGMGFSAIDRRLANPMALWIATIWNIILIVAYVLLCVVGLFMG